MGCDIHLHIELQKNDGTWLHYAAPNIKRNYKLFEKMAGVRGDIDKAIVAPKGLPEDVSEITKAIWGDSGEDTPSWLNSDELIKLDEWLKELDANDTSGTFLPYDLEHTILHTYLNGSTFLAFKKYDDFPYMPSGFKDVRFVFWFDS